MRVLFTFAGGSGHAAPLVPLAAAAQAVDHTVAFAGRASVVAHIRARGFTVFPEPTEAEDAPQTIAPLLELSKEREDQVLRDGFADRIARRRAKGVLALCDDWTPDVIVCDEVDFGSMVAAELAGVPHATVLVIAAGSLVRTEVVGDPLGALRAEYGLAPDPGLEMQSRYLVLSPFPPSFRDPAYPLPATAHSLRLAEAGGHDATPSWLSEPGAAPTVYFTLGTVFNVESGDLFERVLAGVRELSINLIATVGRGVDPRRALTRGERALQRGLRRQAQADRGAEGQRAEVGAARRVGLRPLH